MGKGFTIDLKGWEMAVSTETEPIVFPVSRITEIELAAVNADFVTFVNNRP